MIIIIFLIAKVIFQEDKELATKDFNTELQLKELKTAKEEKKEPKKKLMLLPVK